MIKLKSKLFLSMFFMTIAATLVTGTALAGTSISGDSNVYPGRTYTYTIKVTESASSIMGTATTNGVLGSHSATWSKDSSTGFNQTITATCTITVTIPSSAAIGSTGTITVSGQGSSFNSGDSSPTKFNISGSKTITVVTPPTPPPPTKWELAIKDINKTEEGGSIIVEMNPDKAKELNMPVEALQAIKDRNITMTVDFTSFKCIFVGSEVGEIPNGLDDINLGYSMQPAERPDDMIVFIPNNINPFRYAMTYALTPNLPLPEDMIYVYRYYPESGITEYIDTAKTDENGNVLVYVFTPGQYIVSAKSIEGSVGNMDIQAFIEMFATPTPEPTAVPTTEPTPAPTPTATIVPEDESPEMANGSKWLIGILAGLVVLMGIAIFLMFIKKKPNLPDTQDTDSEK